jgi:hypothetical protein
MGHDEFKGRGQEGDGFWIPVFTRMTATNAALSKKLRCYGIGYPPG